MALHPLIEKLHRVRRELNKRVLEREDETDGVLLAVLAGTSALFLGDVGTAKTYHIQTASRLLGLIDFDILLSETTKPDQIFGPTDIPALANGKQQTKYIGYAPDAEILFFDEIFKANATVLNPLLWIINEHQFRDGDNGVINTPTIATFAASNEIPTDQILKAVYDRFLLRYEVKYITNDHNTRSMVRSVLDGQERPEAILTIDEVLKLRRFVKQVALPDAMLDMAMKIRRQVELTLEHKISDRRFTKAFRIMQASALLNGRKVIEEKDLEILAHVFWNELHEVGKVQSIVFAQTSGDTTEVSTYVEKARELSQLINKGGDLPKMLDEIKFLHKQCKKFASRYAARCAEEIKSIGITLIDIIRMRRTIDVIRVNTSSGVILKVQSQNLAAWNLKELRSFGFRFRRKSTYWFYDKSEKKLRIALKKKGVRLNVQNRKQP